jgi:hypothetical protein
VQCFVRVLVGNDLCKRGYCYCGFNDAESGSGFYRTRVHAGLKRSDALLASAQSLERPCRHIPDPSGHLVRDGGCYSS